MKIHTANGVCGIVWGGANELIIQGVLHKGVSVKHSTHAEDMTMSCS